MTLFREEDGLGAQTVDILGYWSNGRQPVIRRLVLLMALAAILTLLEPFESGVLPWPLRLVYWVLLLVAFSLVFPPAVRLARRIAVGRVRSPVWILAAACAIASVPIWVLVAAIDWLLAMSAVPVFGLSTAPDMPSITEIDFLLLTYASVYLVVALVVGGNSLLVLVRQRNASPDPGLKPGVRFLSRLPARIGAGLVCIRMEDHYLRVTTRDGEALILMRLRDALQELEDYPGLQVHRSWWVATDQIERLSRDRRRLEVMLSNGARVPVSASFRAQVERLVLG